MPWERMDARNCQVRDDGWGKQTPKRVWGGALLAVELRSQHHYAFTLHSQLSFEFAVTGS